MDSAATPDIFHQQTWQVMQSHFKVVKIEMNLKKITKEEMNKDLIYVNIFLFKNMIVIVEEH